MSVRRLLFVVLFASSALDAAAERSLDGRLRWEEGDSAVTLIKRGGFSSRGQRVALPPLEKGARRRVVFAASGDKFAVLDQVSDSVSLHGDSPRGTRAAQALVTGALLRLMDLRGRVLWGKRLPETYAVGSSGGSAPLVLGSDGTAAVLMQDADPYTKEKPLVMVLDPKGREVLRLDYTAWSRIDDMALASDGRWLALRGIGRLPESDSWGSALGHYALEDGGRTLIPAGAASGVRSLRGFDRDGRVCCLVERKELAAYAHDGTRGVLSAAQAEALFGAAP